MRPLRIITFVMCSACLVAAVCCRAKIPEEAFRFEEKKVEEEAGGPGGSEALTGKDKADNLYGMKGDFGLKGTGPGGEGIIGLGKLDTTGSGGGYGYGRGAGLGTKASSGKVKTGSADVQGSLSKEVIRRVIRQHINEVRYCYEKELAKQPDLAGTVKVQFIISPAGAVQTSKVSSSTVGNAGVESCIQKAVGRWKFPSPEGGGVVIVNYPFTLGPADKDKPAEKQ